ncbi:hypothetical protein JBL43_19010 [Aureibaculum sp. A20]|uniref:Uncharacterized protein n=1 Tax=Aureibaculum flavum TaxID=2795986 RepID=A0ABS0WWR2_9FLAO|nr:hypothetical protein [Aureibaculum flavum]MBJ2176350.1 hypothetical protein [Aureibaculum flavum]
MKNVAFDLVLDEKTKKFDIAISEKFYWIGLGGLGIFLIIKWIFQYYMDINIEDVQLVNYVLFGFLICVGIGAIYGWVDYNGNNRIIKGFITFSKDEITINNARRYDLSEIKNLKFNVYDFKGKSINLISDGDPNRSYGGDNFVEFRYQNKQFKYQFVADSDSHRKLLIEKTIPEMKTKTEIKY